MMERRNRSSGREPGSFRLGNIPAKPDPYRQFAEWFGKAKRSGMQDFNAMHLATSGKNGRPSGRMVLLKSFDDNGFVFYTNYLSAKGKTISENPYVAMTFFWSELQFQVRIQGKASKIPGSESDKYFATRTRESKAGAVVSPQSQPVEDRQTLEKKWKDLMRSSAPEGPERPVHCGGYIVKPLLFEFWLGREHRLHDRIRYRLVKGKWKIDRLAP